MSVGGKNLHDYNTAFTIFALMSAHNCKLRDQLHNLCLPWKLSVYDCEPAVNSTTSFSLSRNLCSSLALSMSAALCPPVCRTRKTSLFLTQKTSTYSTEMVDDQSGASLYGMRIRDYRLQNL